MKQPKTQRKSIFKRLLAAVQHNTVDVEEIKEECFHRSWNMDLDSACPDCGITSQEILAIQKMYRSDE